MRVLVATDGSRAGVAAVKFAARLAHGNPDGRLIVLTVEPNGGGPRRARGPGSAEGARWSRAQAAAGRTSGPVSRRVRPPRGRSARGDLAGGGPMPRRHRRRRQRRPRHPGRMGRRRYGPAPDLRGPPAGGGRPGAAPAPGRVTGSREPCGGGVGYVLNLEAARAANRRSPRPHRPERRSRLRDRFLRPHHSLEQEVRGAARPPRARRAGQALLRRDGGPRRERERLLLSQLSRGAPGAGPPERSGPALRALRRYRQRRPQIRGGFALRDPLVSPGAVDGRPCAPRRNPEDVARSNAISPRAPRSASRSGPWRPKTARSSS